MFANSRRDRWFGLQLLLTACLMLAVASSATAGPRKGSGLKMGPSLRPIAHWRLGELKGDVAHDAVGNHHGRYECGVKLGLQGALSYDSNTAAGLDGKAAHVAVPHHKDFELESGTITLWFNASEVVQRQGIFSKDANGFGDGGHFTISLESGGLKLYLNGQHASSNEYQGGLATGPKHRGNREPIAIGANTFASKPGSLHPLCDFFKGRIDEVVIFDRALDGQKIQRLHQEDKIKPPVLVISNKLRLPPQAPPVLRTACSGYQACCKTQDTRR